MLAPLLMAASLLPVEPVADPPTLSELARSADTVVVISVQQTLYSEIGAGLVTGDAVVEVLNAYKGSPTVDTLLIHEQGGPDSACHLPAPAEYSQRFLLFLTRNPAGSYQRIACPLRVLATEVGQFALRVPLRYASVDEGLTVRELRYADPAAFVPAEYLRTDAQADAIQQAYDAADRDGGLIYTRGLLLRELTRVLAGSP